MAALHSVAHFQIEKILEHNPERSHHGGHDEVRPAGIVGVLGHARSVVLARVRTVEGICNSSVATERRLAKGTDLLLYAEYRGPHHSEEPAAPILSCFAQL